MFENSRLSLYEWAQLLSFYDVDVLANAAHRVLGFAEKTVSSAFAKLDSVVMERLVASPVQFVGPFGVEIDEGFSVSKRKGGRGMAQPWQSKGEWVFGISERHTNRTNTFNYGPGTHI